MDSSKLLKSLRDGLWQAAIELKRPSGESHPDTYETPLDETVRDLAAHGVLIGREPETVIGFLNRFDATEGISPPEEVPDALAGEINRITAELRSVRGNHDRDLGGFGDR